MEINSISPARLVKTVSIRSIIILLILSYTVVSQRPGSRDTDRGPPAYAVPKSITLSRKVLLSVFVHTYISNQSYCYSVTNLQVSW